MSFTPAPQPVAGVRRDVFEPEPTPLSTAKATRAAMPIPIAITASATTQVGTPSELSAALPTVASRSSDPK